MPAICLSYRRSDSAAIAGRIYDRLVGRYGAGSVFMDVSDIPYGTDFREQIQTVFRDTKVLIAVVGPQWLGEKATSAARIRQKLDPVRVEILTAMRQRIVVLPVLIDGATMPTADDLPREIREFAFRNALRADSGADFPWHMERLIAAIDLALGLESTTAPAPAAAAPGNAQRLAVLAKGDAASRPTVLKGAMATGRRLLPYFVAPTVALLIAHYLIIMKLDISPTYLRVAMLIIPLATGFLLFRNIRHGVGAAALLGLVIALVSITAMLAIVGWVDGHSVLPAGATEWQETFECFVFITLATAAGNLVARFTDALIPGRF
jgi:TIR domain